MGESREVMGEEPLLNDQKSRDVCYSMDAKV